MPKTPLEKLGHPFHYKVANGGQLGYPLPENRHGQSVRTWVRSIEGGMQKEGLIHSAMTGEWWRLACDEGTHLGGYNKAPNPLTYLSVGMVSSYLNEILALAGKRGITLSGVTLHLANPYYREGDFRAGTMKSGALPPELTMTCETNADDEIIQTLLLDAVSASPLNGLTAGALTSLFTLTHNGGQITPEHVGVLDGDVLPDPGDEFGKLQRAEKTQFDQDIITLVETEEEFLRKTELNPRSFAYLKEGQMPVFMGATCRLRADGLKEIVRDESANATASWRILCDEAEGHGGKGRAPDAATYISAGIGFCFMTQLGRYVKMAKLAVDAYRIVQDTHFSLGGASGGTGKAGTADAVETHVYVDSPQDADTVLEIIRVAETTCFLHAYCRTDLKTKVRYERRRMAS